MPELFSQKLRANFTPEQQDYCLQLVNELKELLNGQTQEEVLAGGDPAIIQKILEIKQEMLNFVLTKKTREMVRQEEAVNSEITRRQKEQIRRESVNFNEIERKNRKGEKLTDDELRFIYKIDGFGFGTVLDDFQEQFIRTIILRRNIKKDVSRLLECDESQISLSQDEFLSERDICYHFGDLKFRDLTYLPDNFPAPEVVNGSLQLTNLDSWPVNALFPRVVNGLLDLAFLKELPDDVLMPEVINGWLDLRSIEALPKNITLPQVVTGHFYLIGLLSFPLELDIPRGIKSIMVGDLSDQELERVKKKYPHVYFSKVK